MTATIHHLHPAPPRTGPARRNRTRRPGSPRGHRRDPGCVLGCRDHRPRLCRVPFGGRDPGCRPVMTRTLAQVITAAMQADCGAAECWAHHLEPCKGTGPGGVHVARLYRAERRGAISGAELHAVLDELVAFTLASVACAGTGAAA